MNSKNLYNLERSVNSQNSKKIICDYLDKSDFVYETAYLDPDLEVSQVIIRKQNGQEVTRGSGKGRNYILGAHAEALENLIFENYQAEKRQKWLYEDVVKQPFLQKHLYMREPLKEGAKDIIRVEKFLSLKEEEDCWVPSAYLDPDIHKKPEWKNLNKTEGSLSGFANNNGCALGISFDDSILHGLNESIERHYLSLFFQDIIGYKTTVKWHLYKQENIDYNSKKKIIEENFGPVLTVYAQTEFGSYVAFSLCPDNQNPYLEEMGAGSSISLKLAIQRSIDELAQGRFIGEVTEKLKERSDYLKRIYRNIHSYKGLKPLIMLPQKNIFSIINEVEEEGVEHDSLQMSVSQQVNYLVENIKQCGFTPTYRTLFKTNEIYLTHVFIPGFDYFYLIRLGAIIAPLKEYKKFDI